VAGLAKQLVAETNKLQSGLFSSLAGRSNIKLSSATAAVPWLQTGALNDLVKAVAYRGKSMTINSGLRTLPQQLILYKWYLNGHKCGIPLAAKPGRSNHNGGLAVDISDSAGWRSALLRYSWTWQGVHKPSAFSTTTTKQEHKLPMLACPVSHRILIQTNPHNHTHAHTYTYTHCDIRR
jgi:hypothetical protein